MGWDGIVLAELRFPKGGAARWKEQVIEEGAYDDWPQFIDGGVDASTVEALLAEMEDPADFLSGSPYESLRSTLKGDSYSLRLWINEDDFRARMGNLATMLRLAERVPGAVGQAYFMASDGNDCVLIRIEGDGSSLEELEYMGATAEPREDDLIDVEAELQAMAKRFEKAAKPAKKKAPAKAKQPAKKPAKAKKPARKAKR